MNGRDQGGGYNSSNPLSWMGDNEWEQITVLKTLLVAGLVVGPMIAAALWRGTEAWLLNLGVLVPAAQAVVTIPSWQSGLDGQRLVVAVLVALAALSLLVHLPGREERAE